MVCKSQVAEIFMAKKDVNYFNFLNNKNHKNL